MRNISRLLLLLLVPAALLNCKKPSKNAGLNVNQEVLKYGITFQFCDAGDTTYLVKDVFVKLTGRDASKIYEFSGSRDFTVRRGILNVGLDPQYMPSVTNPYYFTIEVFGDNYLPVKVPVKIDGSLRQQRVLITLVDLKKPPKGVGVFKKTISVDAAGATLNTEIFGSPILPSTPEFANITIPQGTKFLDANGNVISPNGTLVEVTEVFFSTRTAYSMNCFPQGSMMSDSIVTPSGKIAGFHQSAGFVYLEMSLAGKDIAGFSQPVKIDMVMNPDYVSANTNNPLTAGDVVSTYNFDYAKSRWDFTGYDTLFYSGSTLFSSFTTTRTKYTTVGWVTSKCLQNTRAIFNNDLFLNTTYLLDVFSANGDQKHPLIAGLFVSVTNGEAIENLELPEGPIMIKVYPNNLSNSQYNYFTRNATPAGAFNGEVCGRAFTLNIPRPQNLEAHYFNVVGKCDNNFFVFPTIPTFYKVDETRANLSLLGMVHIGQFATTNLNMGGRYHFYWMSGRNVYTKDKVIDSTTYTRVKPVPETFPGDTLRNLWCF